MLLIHLRIIRGRLCGAEFVRPQPGQKKGRIDLFPGSYLSRLPLLLTFPPQLRSAAQPLRSKRGSIQLAHAVAALVRRRGRSVVEKGGEKFDYSSRRDLPFNFAGNPAHKAQM